MMRKCFVAAVAAAMCLESFAEGVNIRGYGEIEASFSPEEARFQCKTVETAEKVYAKLLRDIPGCAAAAPAGAYAVGIKDKTVYVLSGSDKAALDGRFAKDGISRPEPKKYPPYLDYYDLRALKFYKRPMDSFLGYGVENHWTFAEKVGMGGLVSHGIEFAQTKGPGVFSFLPWDFGVDEAAKAGSILTLSPSFAGQMPQWVFDDYPEKCARPQMHTLVTEWIPGVEGMPFDNDGPGFPDATSPTLAFEKQVIERYRDNPGLGGWQFYCGKPIGDQLGAGMFGVLWDSSEEGLAAQKEWLMRQYTLRELSLRWTGDAHAYRSWNDVPAMQMIDLIGGDWDPDRWDLHDLDWHWAKAPEKREWRPAGWVVRDDVETETPPPADVKWVPVSLPPSQRLNYVDSGRCWYRIHLPKCSWLAKNRSQTLYLRTVGHLMDSGRMTVWANGKKSFSQDGGVLTMLGAPIEAGTLRNDGTDEIVIEMPGGRCCGRLTGPVSLSPNPAQQYPYTDARANARHMDNMRFQHARIVHRFTRVFKFGRALDPNRPISVSGGASPIFADVAKMWGENGFAMQSTSTDGFYWPWLADLGRQYGFYFIGEPSRDVSAEDRFDRNFGTIFYMGASSTAVFMDIEQYMRFEKETGGMTARMPVTRLVGKYLIDEPDIALFDSQLAHRARTGTAYNWNLARGEAQAVHYDATMVSECALADGIVTPERYPIMFDCGADVMDEKIVADLRRYVEAGGTFVAFTECGRHTELQRDAHPIASLSGFETSDFEKGNVEVKFAADEKVFPLWAGRSFNANGYGKYTAANWRYNRMLKKVADDAEVIAAWQPSGKPAAGVRRVGKGRVITIASGFWREAADIRGKWVPSRYNDLTDELFAQVGAKRVTDAGSYNIWTRKATSKNGLEDWLIAFNVALDGEQLPVPEKSTLAFRTAERPTRVFDAFTGKDVPWTYEEGFVRIPEQEFGPFKTRIFAAAKPVPVTAGLPFWWDEKLKYWKKGPDYTFPDVRAKKADILCFEKWKFATDPNGPWRDCVNSTWKLQFPDLKDYRGPAVYRTTFTLPESAKLNRQLVRFGTRTIYDKADLYMNGRKFRSFDQARLHRELQGEQVSDVTDLLVFGGENTLEVRVTGGAKFTAGICDIIWMQAERRLTDEISLKGDWACVMKDFLTENPGVVPGRNSCRFIRRKVKIPGSWAGRDVFIRVVAPENTVGSVVINDRGHNLGGLKPFGNRETINVTDLVRPGEENTVEIWHRHTVPVDWKGKAWGWPLESVLAVDDVVLGVSE